MARTSCASATSTPTSGAHNSCFTTASLSAERPAMAHVRPGACKGWRERNRPPSVDPQSHWRHTAPHRIFGRSCWCSYRVLFVHRPSINAIDPRTVRGLSPWQRWRAARRATMRLPRSALAGCIPAFHYGVPFMSIADLINHQIRLAARPVGLPKASDWSHTTEAVCEPAEGGVTSDPGSLSGPSHARLDQRRKELHPARRHR